jgi:ABC-type multidrug transport system fused ATPase/permease subunit
VLFVVCLFLKIPFFFFVCFRSAFSRALPYSIGTLIEVISSPNPQFSLGGASALLAGVFAVGSIASFFRSSLLSITSERINQKLRQDLFTSIIQKEVSFFDRNRYFFASPSLCVFFSFLLQLTPVSSTGELVNRLSSDVSVIGKALTVNVASGLRGMVEGIGAVAVLFYIAPKLTFLMLGVIPPVALAGSSISRFFSLFFFPRLLPATHCSTATFKKALFLASL